MRQYQVTANGKELPVYKVNVSAVPFNRVWAGEQRSKEQTEPAYFVTLDADGPVTLSVTVNEPFEWYEIRPRSYRLQDTRSGDTVILTADGPMQFVFTADGLHHALHIFINPKSARPQGDILYYGPGVHTVGLIWLQSGQTLYLDEGAWVYGTIFAKEAEHVRILGRGVLDSSPYRRENDPAPDGHEIRDALAEKGVYTPEVLRPSLTCANLILWGCRDVLVEGITLVDSMRWSVIVRNHCEDITLDNIKLIGQWRYNADGIDICASRNVTVKNCFVRSFDDCFVARAPYLEGETWDVEDITVENCVLWCDWGKALEIWCGDKPCAVRRITFRNIFIAHLDQMAMAVSTWYGSGNTVVEDLAYRDIFIDGEDAYPVPQIQSAEHPVYLPQTGFVPHLVNIHAMKLGRFTGNQGFAPAEDLSVFHIAYRSITFENVHYSGIPLKVEVQPIPGVLEISGIHVKNCGFAISEP